ncbi:MAG: hypothetical protein HC799_10940 [Limnothrix sp. RL_2_0]|nr:hypothetical protein [Limnothrix sp. RL_2_0]
MKTTNLGDRLKTTIRNTGDRTAWAAPRNKPEIPEVVNISGLYIKDTITV